MNLSTNTSPDEPVQALEIVSPTQTTPEIFEYLTKEETDELNELESKVESNFDLALENLEKAGQFLYLIKGKRYYTKKKLGSNEPCFTKFKDYMKYRFNRSRTTGYNYIILYQIMSVLRDGGFEASDLGSLSNAILLHDGARDLLKSDAISAEEIENYSRQVYIAFWKVIYRIAPIVHGKPEITPALVASVVDVFQEAAKSGTVEIEGEQVPVSVTSMVVDSNILEHFREKLMQQRTQLSEELEGAKQRRIEEIPPRKTFDDQSQEFQVPTKVFQVMCPDHGETRPLCSVLAGFKTVCGCLALLEQTGPVSFEFVWTMQE